LKQYISLSDIPLLAYTLSILALLLEVVPQRAYPLIESDPLKNIYQIAHSPLITSHSLDTLLSFFAQLVRADGQISTHVIPSLTLPLQKLKRGDVSFVNVAKCIGIVVDCHHALAAGTIAEFSKALKVSFRHSAVRFNHLLNFSTDLTHQVLKSF
jgi:cullin-associated NEDD8-dissociated protein 1